MHVAKASSDGKVGADGRECLVDVVYVLWLGIERGIVDTLVVDTVLLTASDSDFLVLESALDMLSLTHQRVVSVPFRAIASWEPCAEDTWQ